MSRTDLNLVKKYSADNSVNSLMEKYLKDNTRGRYQTYKLSSFQQKTVRHWYFTEKRSFQCGTLFNTPTERRTDNA